MSGDAPVQCVFEFVIDKTLEAGISGDTAKQISAASGLYLWLAFCLSSYQMSSGGWGSKFGASWV